MTSTRLLFTVPIGDSGRVVCKTPADRVYVLEFECAPDNRLTTAFCQALLTALDIVELRFPHGVLVTTSTIAKFYSNGLDLEHANFTPGFFPESLYALWKRLLIYPMPTVALINGHCFAGALMLAMYHDYRIMNPHKGFLCLNEVELGMPLKPAMSSIFRQKVGPQTYRTLVLEAKRYKALEALKEGIIDGLGALPETLTFIDEMKLVTKVEKGVFGALRREMFRESLAYLTESDEESGKGVGTALSEKVAEAKAKDLRVKKWEAVKSKSKL